ncbi:MAG: MarR family winged helix-turn-helix transcriptional regulator, partial [Corynebacterium variabile]
MTDINNTTGNTGSAGENTTGNTAELAARLFVLMRAADRERRRGDGPVEEHEGHRGHDGGRGRGGHGGRGGRGGFRGEIRSGQGRVLGILALQSPLPQKNLAYMLGVRPQSLSELIAKLETAGLVTRERDENDRRSFLIELTETGREAASEIDASTGEDPFDVLTDEERETWCTRTTKVTDALEEKYPEIGERARNFREAGREFGRGPGFGPGF